MLRRSSAQRWYKVGEFLRSYRNDKCVDIKGLNPNNGAVVQMWDCWTTASQR